MWCYRLSGKITDIFGTLLLIAFCCSGGLPAWAAPPTAAVVELFRYGQVEGNSSAYRIGENGGIFLKIIKGEKSRCLKLDKPGDYPIAQVMVETDESATFFDFFKCNLKALVLRLKTPSRMVITPIPRGASPDDKNSDRIFEEIWRKTVLGETADIPAENMLAAAIWYSGEKRNPARSAYILEKAYDQYRRDWFLQLHHDAYASTAPSSIDREVDKTKNSLLNYYSTDSNIALLIGVQNYGKDSGWPALRTPINDIRKLRNLLVHEYHFNPDNVHMLSNASYQAILDSLRLLRDKVDERTNLLVYYAGHGLVDEDGEYFWIPSDGGRSPKTWIYTEYILKKIKNLNSLHTLLVVDSCFSGALNEHESRSRTDHGVRKLYRKTSRQLITAGGNEPVADGGGTQNSVFARSFLEILQNQPDDQPLSTQELFSKLQPVVADMSNQTPTYDRIPNSRDQWGQFYFFKNPQAVALIDKDDGKTESGAVTSVEDLPATIVDSLNLSKSDEARGSVAELLFQRDETLIDTRDIVESEQVTLLGALVSFGIRIKTFPVSIQMKYASGEKNRTDTVVYGQKEYTVPEAISCIDMLIGLRSVNNNNPTRWISEIGLYYHWKRIQVEWDTSTLVVKKTDSEYVNRGYHLLDLQNFKAWKANEHLALGLNTNFLLGLVTVSGSTQVARNEKYNKDVANLILGTSLGPEMRFRFPTVHVDMRVGSNLEYLWQPQDDKGGSKAGPNKINATLYTSKIYATFGLGF